MADGVVISLTPESLAAVEKINEQIVARRIDLHDNFADFDRLRSRGITPEQFTRVLTLNQIDLTPEELAALIQQFGWRPVASGRGGASTSLSARTAGTWNDNVFVNYQGFLNTLKQYLKQGQRENSPGGGTGYGKRSATPSSLSTTEEEQLEPVLQRIRHIIQSRGLHVVPVFKNMDPLRTGKVTESQFTRCITMTLQQQLALHAPLPRRELSSSTPSAALGGGSGVGPTVLDLIVKKYGDGHGNVHYMAWCRDVDDTLNGGAASANGRPHMGKEPSALSNGPLDSVFAQASGVSNPDLTATELVEILRTQFSLYRLRCEDYFADFDPFKTGLVTAPQFESALGRLKFVKFSLTPENIATLIYAYSAELPVDEPQPSESHLVKDAVETGTFPYRRVCYTQFLYDINPKNFPSTGLSSNVLPVNYFHKTHASNTFLSSAQERTEADRVLEKVRRQVSTNRIFLTPVLRDMDRVRKSISEHRICTAPRFARALATQKVILPHHELQLLIRKYTVPHADGSPSGDVHYYQFVVDVDPSQASSAANPTTTTTTTATLMRGVGSTGVGSQPCGEADAVDLPTVLRRICLQAEERHLRVDAFFIDFDPLRSSKLARSHFITALGTAGLVLSEEELAVLADAYEGRSKVKGTLNMLAFLQDLKDTEKEMRATGVVGGWGVTTVASASAKESKEALLASFTLDEQEQLERLHVRLRHHVASYNTMLAPFFSDFDRFHRGKITKSNFIQALRRHEFLLTERDIELLSRRYACPSDPSLIAYCTFLAALEGKEGGEKGAAEGGDNDLAASSPAGGKGADQSVTVEEVLARLCAHVRTRRPALTEAFADADELSHGRVSQGHFRHGLGLLGMGALTAAELSALEDAFAATPSKAESGGRKGGGAPVEVDYVAFIAAVRAGLANGVDRRRPVEQSQPRDRNASWEGASVVVNGLAGAMQTQEAKLYAETITKIRRKLGSRRTQAVMAFREYDRKRKGYVKEGQFFSCLCALLGVPQTPLEASVLTKAFSSGNGEMEYMRFCAEVDDESFKAVS